MKRLSLRAGATMVALVLATALPSAAMQPTEGSSNLDANGAISVTSDAEYEDLRDMASEMEIPMDEAVARFAWQDDFSIAATRLSEDFPGEFVQSEITSEDPAAGVIRFKNDVPNRADEYVAHLEELVDIKLVGGEGMSREEIDEAIIAAHQAVDATGEVGDSVASYDREAGVVRVTATPREPIEESLRTSDTQTTLRDHAQTVTAKLPELDVDVDLTFVPHMENRTEDRNGGGRLEFSGTNDPACTGGFNVLKGGSVSGVATAGHCDNALTHENENGWAEYALTYQGGHRGEWGDFQWHTSVDSEPDVFYHGFGFTYTVSRVVVPSLGQTICRFGQTTGYRCNQVADLSMSATLEAVLTSRLVRMNDDRAQGGDSGGPWHHGYGAYGYHTGQVYCGSSTCDVWSRAEYIDNALGVSVRED